MTVSGPSLCWPGMRRDDLLRWPPMLVRALPGRVRRLVAALSQVGQLPVGKRPAHCLPPLADRFHRFLAALFDLLGGPEAVQVLLHLGMNTAPLSSPEIAAISGQLGPAAIDYSAVRVATGGVLSLIFRLNGGRAFAAWHTIALPAGARADLSLLVHEATHVYQYEQLGSAYIVEALYAQRQLGRACYDYGGVAGLTAGVPYRAFNREAQAQIVQDCHRAHTSDRSLAPYLPYIAALRRAEL